MKNVLHLMLKTGFNISVNLGRTQLTRPKAVFKHQKGGEIIFTFYFIRPQFLVENLAGGHFQKQQVPRDPPAAVDTPDIQMFGGEI